MVVLHHLHLQGLHGGFIVRSCSTYLLVSSSKASLVAPLFEPLISFLCSLQLVDGQLQQRFPIHVSKGKPPLVVSDAIHLVENMLTLPITFFFKGTSSTYSLFSQLCGFWIVGSTTFQTTAHCCMRFVHMMALALSALMNSSLWTPRTAPQKRFMPSLCCKFVTSLIAAITLSTSPCGRLCGLIKSSDLLPSAQSASLRCACHSVIYRALPSWPTTILSTARSPS